MPGALAQEVSEALEGRGRPLMHRLQESGVLDAEASLRSVISMAEDSLARDRYIEVLEHLLHVIPASADTDMALRNFDRFTRVVVDRNVFYGFLLQYPVLIRFLVDLLSFSQFLADILIRNPEYFEWLLTPDQLEADRTLESCRESLRKSVAPFQKRETLRRVACRWKRRELLRIGVRDMLGKADIRQCARELTWVAEAMIELAALESRRECEERYGTPRSEFSTADAAPTPFAVYGMGKLGGTDLNFSSDIDLIFVYGEEGETAGTPDRTGTIIHRITNHEYFTKVCERIISFLGDMSDEGLLFRVDMRLRPEGKTGPLVRSLSSYMIYFTDQARSWEKVAYLKARCVWGDAVLSDAFDRRIAHFVFSGNLPGPLSSDMARMKRRIDHEVLDEAGRERDLKRGLGGIREIEFITIRQQLLEGQKDDALRTRDTVEALQRLGSRGRIPEDDAQFLTAAYAFLRRLEHRLQMMAERQTYLLPESGEAWGRLARRTGYLEGLLDEAGNRLRTAFQEITGRVRTIFQREFNIEPDPQRQRDPIDLLLHPVTDEDTVNAFGFLEQHGFREPAVSSVALQSLAFGTAERVVTSRGQRWFEQVLPNLLDLAGSLPFPDPAIRFLDAFLTATKGRTLVYELLAETPAVLRMLMTAFGSGPVLSRSLIAHPEWFDEILETGAITSGIDIAAMESGLSGQIAVAKEDDAAWRRLRRWREKTGLVLGILEVLDLESEMRLGRMTSDMADLCLRCVTRRVEQRLREEIGNPIGGPDGEGDPIPWSILGMGGFGGRHVSHFSDLDIVLLFSESGRVIGPRSMTASEWFSRLGEEVIRVMTAVSPEGQLFKVDARLRPEGRNAPLAASLDRYIQYYASDAQTWEWQAILRARHIAGDASLSDQFFKGVFERVPKRFPEDAALVKDVRSMRDRLAAAVKVPRWAECELKRGSGGIADAEFVVQFLQLREMRNTEDVEKRVAIAIPVLEDAVHSLVERNVLDREDADALLEEYDFIRGLQRRARLLFETSRDFFPSKDDRLDPLCRAMRSRLGESTDLVTRLHDAQKRLRAIFNRLIV